MSNKLGSHLIFDVFNTKFDLNDFDLLKNGLEGLMNEYKFSVVGFLHKQFEPQGLTMVWLLEESHLSIHTWPESGKLTLDLYHCLDTARETLSKFAVGLGQLFGTENVVTNFILDRGVPSKMLNFEESNGFFSFFPGVTSLHAEQSPFQKLEILEHPWFGRALILDGVIQFCDRFTDVYSPALTDPIFASLVKPVSTSYYSKVLGMFKSTPKARILIVGGGDGRIAYYMKQKHYAALEHLTVVDIDKKVSDVCAKYFPSVVTLEDPKVTYHYQDAIEWVQQPQNQSQLYDGVIIDSTDPTVGISIGLYTKEFYSNVQKLMKPGAILTQQGDTNDQALATLMPIFKQTTLKFHGMQKVHTVEYTGETSILTFINSI